MRDQSVTDCVGERPLVDSGKLAELEAVIGNGPLTDMLRLVPSSARAELERVRSGLADGDHEAAARAVHTLRGFSGNLGLDRLSTAAGHLLGVLRDQQRLARQPAADAGAETERLCALLETAVDDTLAEIGRRA